MLKSMKELKLYWKLHSSLCKYWLFFSPIREAYKKQPCQRLKYFYPFPLACSNRSLVSLYGACWMKQPSLKTYHNKVLLLPVSYAMFLHPVQEVLVCHLWFHLFQSTLLPRPKIIQSGVCSSVPMNHLIHCGIKVKFILDKESDRDFAQVTICIRILKEQVFVCLDLFKLLWKRHKGD